MTSSLYHHCERYGVVIELANEDRDESEHGRNLRTLAGMLARMERSDIRRRTLRGRAARAAKGYIHPSAVPLYGYVWRDVTQGDKAAYAVDPETADTVRYIFAQVAAGVPIRRLCADLEARSVPTPAAVFAARGLWTRRVLDPQTGTLRIEPLPYSNVWWPGCVLRILRTPAYWGGYRLNRWQTESVKTRPAGGVTRKVRRAHERPQDDAACLPVGERACPALVSVALAQAAQARRQVTKAASAGHNPDPQATLWRGMARCGHCDGRLHTTTGRSSRVYTHAGILRADPVTGARAVCPGGCFTMAARLLDPAGWRDVLAWLADPQNVARLFALWETQQGQAAQSLSGRLAAVEATSAEVRARMSRLTDAIADTADAESRHVLQEKLDDLAAQVHREDAKRAKLLDEAHDAAARAQAQREMAAWVRVVAEQAPTFSRAEQIATLRALGAEVTVWRDDYVHADGWPRRYRVALHFTGLTGAPILLPPAPDAPAPDASAPDTVPSLLVSSNL